MATVANKPTPASLRALARRDPALGRAMRRVTPYPGFPSGGGADSHFHSLARTIIYQQLAGNAAATIHDRVRALTPGRRFPRAEELATLPDRAIQAAGISRNKLRALRDLTDRVLDGRLKLRSVARADDATVIEQLTEIHGIGEWSAQMFLLFRLGRLDVLPAGDLGVQEGLKRLDGLKERPTPRELLKRGECWRPLASVATWVLYRLVDED
ncbi:MAG: hypothetical protein MK085_00835 [Phycisphaerales bacterium]|nr:hypothetical protein [Phycisphaerales bacterium]